MATQIKPRPVIEMLPVTSSQIKAIGHHPETNTLAIEFPTRAVEPSIYHYANFTAEQFDAFLKAESVGSHFIQNIKKHPDVHPHTRIS